MNVVVYSRKECGCCERALAILEPRRAAHPFDLRIVDIDTDDDLKARFGAVVPVIEIDGVERFRGQINPVLLDRILAGGAG